MRIPGLNIVPNTLSWEGELITVQIVSWQLDIDLGSQKQEPYATK